MGNFVIRVHDQWGKTTNKMGRRRPQGHITGRRNTRMGETSRRQRRMEASSKGDHGPRKGVVAPQRELKVKQTFLCLGMAAGE